LILEYFWSDRSVDADDDVTSLTVRSGNAQNGAAAFATTHWSVVLEASPHTFAGIEMMNRVSAAAAEKRRRPSTRLRLG